MKLCSFRIYFQYTHTVRKLLSFCYVFLNFSCNTPHSSLFYQYFIYIVIPVLLII
ncbi:hypothetical protein HMPREF3033_00782 [Veillonellaceae bacterium DNF00751]|nr:hypothetical protein HMPREF3033_00782 [Veillonellaceae bacterium DNF00751]